MIRVLLPDAPPVAGLVFRFYSGDEELPALMALRAAIAADAEAGWMPTEDQFECDADDIPFPKRDCLIAQISGEFVGFTWLNHWIDRPDKHVYLLRAFLHPAYRRKHIGRAILHWQENHARSLHHALHAVAPFEFAANADDNQPSLRALLDSEGYHIGSTMIRLARNDLDHIPPVPLPPGFEIRPIQSDQLSQVWQLIHNCLPDGDESYAESSLCDLSLWSAAFHGDDLAGIVVNHIRNSTAETPWVAVAEPFRRRGLAKALMSHSLTTLRSRGALSATLETSLQNPNDTLRLYQSVGYHITKRMPRYRKPAV